MALPRAADDLRRRGRLKSWAVPLTVAPTPRPRPAACPSIMAHASPAKVTEMSSSNVRPSSVPEGAGVLFFVQMFSTLGYAVLYSTLTLYTTKHLHFSDKLSFALMGVFGAWAAAS